ncbi:zinc-ribbon domain containing protein [Patescibacteria group bacterium]
MKDKVITCENCKQDFAWTAGEQDFYKQKGLKPPIHCLICRTALSEAKKDNFRGKIEK